MITDMGIVDHIVGDQFAAAVGHQAAYFEGPDRHPPMGSVSMNVAAGTGQQMETGAAVGADGSAVPALLGVGAAASAEIGRAGHPDTGEVRLENFHNGLGDRFQFFLKSPGVKELLAEFTQAGHPFFRLLAFGDVVIPDDDRLAPVVADGLPIGERPPAGAVQAGSLNRCS